MAFLVNLISEADLVTRARLASTPIEQGDLIAAPDYERIRQWQAEVQPEVNAKKSMSNDESRQTTPRKTVNRTKVWKKFIETIRPGERKKRRAREFDAIMRREIEQPVGDTTEPEMWRTAIAEVTQLGREGLDMSLQDALDLLEPPDEEEDIIALPPIPTYLQEPQKEVIRPLPESELRLFAPGMM